LTWRWWQHPALLDVCVVNFKHDKEMAIRGLLWRTRGSWWLMRDCTVLVTGKPPGHIDGDVLIHASTVAFVQRLTATVPQAEDDHAR
jgi:hypothetical protein